MAAAMSSGNASGVHANAGTPIAARSAAFSRSYAGAPSSDSASSTITCTPAPVIAATRRSISSRTPPSYRSLISTKIESRGRVTRPWAYAVARAVDAGRPVERTGHRGAGLLFQPAFKFGHHRRDDLAGGLPGAVRHHAGQRQQRAHQVDVRLDGSQHLGFEQQPGEVEALD